MVRLPYFTVEEIRGSKREEVRRIIRSAEGDVQAAAVTLVAELIPSAERRRECRVLECGAGSGAYAAKLAAIGFQNVFTADLDDYVSDYMSIGGGLYSGVSSRRFFTRSTAMAGSFV